MIEGLPALLRGESTISALVGTRVYPYHAPQTATLPYIVVTQLNSEEFKDMTSTGSLRAVDFDVDCKADRATESRTLGKIVREFLDDYSGAAGSETISAVLMNNESTEYEPPTDGSDRGIYTTLLDLTIQYTPA